MFWAAVFGAVILGGIIIGSIAICYAIGAEHGDVIRALHSEEIYDNEW